MHIPQKKRSCKKYSDFASIFLARLARSCTKSCKSCTKNETFLARYEKSCKNLARKFCKIIFLQDFDHTLQENYLTILSCKILARIFVSCKKSFIFSARLARKILARFAYFLQDGFYWDLTLVYRQSFFQTLCSSLLPKFFTAKVFTVRYIRQSSEVQLSPISLPSVCSAPITSQSSDS